MRLFDSLRSIFYIALFAILYTFSVSAYADSDPYGFDFIYRGSGSRQYKLDEAKALYRRKVMKVHPDQGGDEEEFKALTNLYNSMKKKIEALPENGKLASASRPRQTTTEKPKPEQRQEPRPKPRPKPQEPQIRYRGGKYEVNYFEVFDLNFDQHYQRYTATIVSLSNDPNFMRQKQMSEIELARHRQNAIAIFSDYDEFLKYVQGLREKQIISVAQIDIIFDTLRAAFNQARKNPYQNCMMNLHNVGRILDIKI